MKEILRFDIKDNGLVSAIPYISSAITGILVVSYIVDWIRPRGYRSEKDTGCAKGLLPQTLKCKTQKSPRP